MINMQAAKRVRRADTPVPQRKGVGGRPGAPAWTFLGVSKTKFSEWIWWEHELGVAAMRDAVLPGFTEAELAAIWNSLEAMRAAFNSR